MKPSTILSSAAAGVLLSAGLATPAALPDAQRFQPEPVQEGAYDPNVSIQCQKKYTGTLHIVGTDGMMTGKLGAGDMPIKVLNNGHKTLVVAMGRDAMYPTQFVYEECHAPALNGKTGEVFGQLRPVKTAAENDCVSASRNNINGSADEMDNGPNELQIEACANHENAHLQRQLFQAVYSATGHNGQPSVELTLVGTPERVSSRGYKPEVAVMDDKEFDIKSAVTVSTTNNKGKVDKTLALFNVKQM